MDETLTLTQIYALQCSTGVSHLLPLGLDEDFLQATHEILTYLGKLCSSC